MTTASGGGSLLPGGAGGGGAAAGNADAGAGGATAAGSAGTATIAGGMTAGGAAGSAVVSTGAVATGDWQSRGYESETLAKYRNGQFKTHDALFKSYDEFGTLVNKHSDEAKAAQTRAAELEQLFGQHSQVFGAPKNEDGSPRDYDMQWDPAAEVDPTLNGRFSEFLRKHNLAEPVAQEAAQMLQDWAAGQALGTREVELAGVLADQGYTPDQIEQALADPTKFGETEVGKAAAAKLGELERFWTERIGEQKELVEAMHEVASRREGVRFLELLRSSVSAIKNGPVAGQSGPETTSDIMAEAKGNPDFFMDPRNDARLTAARTRELGDRANKPVKGGE